MAAKKIVDTYLSDKAARQVNVGHVLRSKVLNNFKNCDDKNCPTNLFDEMRVNIYIELKQDCLQNFLQGSTFHKFVKRQLKVDPDYLGSIGTLKPHLDVPTEETVEVDTENENEKLKQLGVLYDPNVIEATDSDFDRVYHDIRDLEMWRPVFQSEKRTVYVSKNPFYSGKKGLKKMFETGILPCSVDEAFNAYADPTTLMVIEKEISKITNIDYKEGTKYASVVVRFQYKLPFPLKNRDFCLLHSVRKEPNGNMIMLRKSVNHEMCPVDRAYIRGVVSGGICFEKVDEYHTRYSQTYFVDYGGWISAPMFNKIIEMRDDYWHNTVIKSVALRREKGLGRPVVSNRVIDTLEFFEKHLESTEGVTPTVDASSPENAEGTSTSNTMITPRVQACK
jgi:hypothetical protein